MNCKYCGKIVKDGIGIFPNWGSTVMHIRGVKNEGAGATRFCNLECMYKNSLKGIATSESFPSRNIIPEGWMQIASGIVQEGDMFHNGTTWLLVETTIGKVVTPASNFIRKC